MTIKPRPPSEASERAGETKARLIEAGLDLFGQSGFEGTSTRALAKRARTNLAALPYHFGGKEGLYRAVVTHIVEQVRARLLGDPRLVHALQNPPADAAAARALIHTLLDRLADIIIGSDEARRWALIVVREQMQPSPAFDILYKGVMERVLGGALPWVAAATGKTRITEAEKLRAFSLFGLIIVFRAARNMVKRTLGWHEIGPAELAILKPILHANIDGILDQGARS